MDRKTYYEGFDGWEESIRLRYMSALTDFGPSPEICEAACSFSAEKNADRLIRWLLIHIRRRQWERWKKDGTSDQADFCLSAPSVCRRQAGGAFTASS